VHLSSVSAITLGVCFPYLLSVAVSQVSSRPSCGLNVAMHLSVVCMLSVNEQSYDRIMLTKAVVCRKRSSQEETMYRQAGLLGTAG